MRQPKFWIILFLLVGIAADFGCSRCETMDDEAVIRNILEQGVVFAEASDVKSIMKVATGDFKLLPGGRSANEVRMQLQLFFRQVGSVTIHYPRPTVNVDRETKTFAEVQMPFALHRKGYPFPELSGLFDDPKSWLSKADAVADVYTLDLWFIKKNEDWQVRKAQIQGGIP